MSPDQTEDIQDLAGFGYRQVLDRTLGGFSSFAAGFSFISILTGVFQMFYAGYDAGGPAFFWTWPLVFVGQFTVALCFAELAARFPLSGGIYQWSRWVGSGGIGWLAGWVYLSGSIISLAAVALALQATLPQIAPVFQLIGDPGDKNASAANAVILGCLLIGLTTVINAIGVRLMARINNVGVMAELIGVTVLIGLLAINIRRSPAILFDGQGRGLGQPGGYIGPFLAAALMASYVMYGFDTAGTLAEETDNPRRRAPRGMLHSLAAAGLSGGLLIVCGILAVRDPAHADLSQISGGLPYLVKDVLGAKLGILLLTLVIFAVFVCALAVHAGTIRLMFAMARDNNLPFAHSLAHVQTWSRAPVVPSIVVGVLAAGILAANINFPNVIETLCSVAIVWANLAYLLVTAPLLYVRLRNWAGRADKSAHDGPSTNLREEPPRRESVRPYFSMGRWGMPVNFVAVIWGLFVVVNIGWPREQVYGSNIWGRYAAPLATLALIAIGLLYYVLIQRKRTGILSEHAADDILESRDVPCEDLPIDRRWLGQLAPGDLGAGS